MKDSQTRVELQLAAIVVLVCLWIVAVWTPVLGTLHANLAIKIFWTVISVLVLGIVAGPYVSHRRRASRRVHGPRTDRPER